MKSALHTILLDYVSFTHDIEVKLIESGGEITPELEALLSFKEMNKEALISHADMIAGSMERLALTIEHYKASIAHVQKLLKALERSREKLGDNVKDVMESLGIEHLEGIQRSVKIRKNPPSVEIYNQDVIPDSFKDIEIVEKIRKLDLRDALKKGEVPGARLTSGTSLMIQMNKITKGLSYDESSTDHDE